LGIRWVEKGERNVFWYLSSLAPTAGIQPRRLYYGRFIDGCHNITLKPAVLDSIPDTSLGTGYLESIENAESCEYRIIV